MGSSWYLFLFAGIFNIALFISSISLLYAISKATETYPMVYATAVIVTPPSGMITNNTLVVQGRVISGPSKSSVCCEFEKLNYEW